MSKVKFVSRLWTLDFKLRAFILYRAKAKLFCFRKKLDILRRECVKCKNSRFYYVLIYFSTMARPLLYASRMSQFEKIREDGGWK